MKLRKCTLVFFVTTVVHVTDLHCCYENVARLKEWLKKEQQKIDVVLISGDIANFPIEKYYKDDQALELEHHEILLKITAEFISVAEKVYFIPGNVRELSKVLMSNDRDRE